MDGFDRFRVSNLPEIADVSEPRGSVEVYNGMPKYQKGIGRV